MAAQVESTVLKGLPIVANPATPGTGLLQTASAHLFNVCKPTKLLLRAVSATYDPTGFLFPPAYGTTEQNQRDPSPALSGARTGLTVEGPFVRYTVARPDMERARRAQRGSQNFALVGGLHSEMSRTFIFDASIGRPICLPYAGRVELITQYPGTWIYEFVTLEWDETQISPIESEVTLSLVLRDDDVAVKNRTFGIPIGAHSMTYRDSHTTDTVWPTITTQADIVSRAAVVTAAGKIYSASALRDAFAQSQQFLGRVGLGNVITVRVDGVPAVPGQGVATFHISLC